MESSPTWIERTLGFNEIVKDDVPGMMKTLDRVSCLKIREIPRWVLSPCLRLATMCRSMRVLKYLLKYHGELAREIRPRDVVMLYQQGEAEFSLPSIELLDLLFDHGWNIDRMKSPRKESGPLLWRICHSPELVQWCLDHDAKLVIPNERTSQDPNSADIFHTPRHLLLLEMVAKVGNATTFEQLYSVGAPLTPGVNWLRYHAPMILHIAVYAAAVLPWQANASNSEFDTRVEMIKYLVDNVKLDVNGVCGGHSSAIIGPKFHDPHWKVRRNGKRGQGIVKIMKFLVTSGANVKFALNFPDDQCCSTPLGCLRYVDKDFFQSMVYDWLSQPAKPVDPELSRSTQLVRIQGERVTIRPELCNLPQEILSVIGSFLELVDLNNVRLTSRLLETGVFDCFRQFIRSKHITLTTNPVKEVIKKLRHSKLGCYIEELVVTPQTTWSENVRGMLQLTYLFRGKCISENLRSLDIRAATRFEITAFLRALCASELQPHTLSLQHDARSDTGDIGYFRMFPDLTKLARRLSSLRKFTWSLSNEMRNGGAIPTLNVFEGVSTTMQLLMTMPSVEVLNLLWYRWPGILSPDSHFFHFCVDGMLAMKLKIVH